MGARLRRVLVAVALAVAGQAYAPDAHAGIVSGASIVVNSPADTDVRDAVVTLREAVSLATGFLAKASLTASELAQVTGNPGSSSADDVTFDPAVFPAGSPAEIHLDFGLSLTSGSDSVRGSGAVRITCEPAVSEVFFIPSSNNVISGLEITGCRTAILLAGDASNNVIGGTQPGQGNVLVDNRAGVLISSFTIFPFDNPDDNRIVGNHIGVRPGATVEAGNEVGVGVFLGRDNVIEGNVISGNTGAGVVITSSDTIVRGNRIGTDTPGLVPVPNGVGVRIEGPAMFFPSTGNVIGGVTETDQNLISGNGIGVEVSATGMEASARDNSILGNHIGTAADGTTPLPNGTGVRLDGEVQVFVGGTEPGAGNVIAFNDAAGLSLVGDGATQNSFRANAIHSNGALAIDLGADGVTPNDDTDGTAIGPNGFQNFPVLTAVSYTPSEPPAGSGILVVEGTLETKPLEGDLTVEVFASAACDPSGHGEAELPMPALTTTGLTTEADGSVGFVASAAMPVPALRVLTATATSRERGTSELSACAMLVGFGEPCAGDGDCDDGDACTGVETCVDGACEGGTPVACDDGRACNGVAACADGVCQPAAPLDCDDAERCTDDGCDDASGCQHTPRSGVAAVTCRLDTMADLLSAAEVPDKLRRKLDGRIGRTRTKLETLSDEDAGAISPVGASGPGEQLARRESRAIKKARRQLTGIGKTADRQRGKKLPEATADALAAAAGDALGRLAALESALATAAPRDGGA